jgi:NTP pyrophosphatase (non-canonical NTP hydrolase)
MSKKIAKTDYHTTMGELRDAVASFVTAREWGRYHSPKNLAMSMAIEATEIMEIFQWSDPAEGAIILADPEVRAAVADELADVLIYMLSFANQVDLDLSQAFWQKMARNESRFPVDQVLAGKLDPKVGDPDGRESGLQQDR